MPVKNEVDLREAVNEASRLLQDIQDYAGRSKRDDAKVRFPRGFLRTANECRKLLPGYMEHDRASNCAYAFMYLDILWWLTNRTDIAATAKEMVLKSAIITLGTVTEAVLRIRDEPGFGKNTDFNDRLEAAYTRDLINEDDKRVLSKLWKDRNNVHQKNLDAPSEFDKYAVDDVNLPLAALERLLKVLREWDRSEGDHPFRGDGKIKGN
jgi:hypothetical protein